jgi:hypothetical protein
MSRALLRRIARLERRMPPVTIPIYVEDEAEVERRIGELIAARKLAEADRPWCVHWTRHDLGRPPRHEDRVIAMIELDADKARCRSRAARAREAPDGEPQSS